jgi:hypothetical protein
MGVTWAIAWALAGVGIGLASLVLPLGWFFALFDAPLPALAIPGFFGGAIFSVVLGVAGALAIPGFFGGAIFSVVLGVAGRRRRFDQLSMPRFMLWGALGGVLLSLAPAALVALNLATPATGVGALNLTLAIVGPLTILSAGSAAVTLGLARLTEDSGALAGVDEIADAGLTAEERRELLGDG